MDLTAAERWSPAAASPSGDDVPLGDVLDRLLDGLLDGRAPHRSR